MSTDPLLITVAPTGAETTKADCPQLPTTTEEIVATAVECEAAGAAMIHVHIRDDDHRPTLDLNRLKETVAALRESTDLVVQLSTGGSVHDPYDARLAVLDAEPDSCSLTMGTTNFGDDVFSNPWPFVCELYQATQERGIVPEFELFDLGQVAALGRLLDQFGLPAGGKVHCDFVMGVPGGMPGTTPALVAGLAHAAPADHVVVGHRHRPDHASGVVRRIESRRKSPGRDGGRGHAQPRRPGREQRPTGPPSRRNRRSGAARPHDHRAGSLPVGPARARGRGIPSMTP